MAARTRVSLRAPLFCNCTTVSGETRIGQGRDSAKQYLRDNPEIAAKLEADIRRDFHKLMSSQSKIAARAAGRAVDVSADDFEG